MELTFDGPNLGVAYQSLTDTPGEHLTLLTERWRVDPNTGALTQVATHSDLHGAVGFLTPTWIAEHWEC